MSYKEVQKRKNLTSRVLQLQVNRFISNISNQIIMPSRPIRATVNKNGFIEVLNGAIKSNDSETLESIMPKEVDLSIRQNGGFSVFLWLHTKKINASNTKIIYYIFKKGGTVDQFTPSIGLSNNQTNLIIELSTSKSKKETLFANKVIEENHLYSIGISFAIDYEDDSTEVSLYIDGKLDTQSSIPGEPIHNQGSVFFGRPDSSTHGFKGTVADVMMVPSTITEREVSMAHSEGLKNLYDSNGATLGMSRVFGEIFKRKKLINKYAYYTKKSVYEIENLCLSNSKMLEIVKNYDKEEKENDIRPPPELRDYKQEKMNREMTSFLSDIDNRILCNKIDINGQLINTCFFLANQGEEMLEIDRVIKIFDTLKEVLLFTVEKKFIEVLAKILYAYFDDKENNTQYLKTKTFFVNLQAALDNLDLSEKQVEEENAKFLKGKKKTQPRNLLSCLRRTKPENSDPLPLEETRGFGNCIPEHEVLLLKTQNIKNSIDIEQEENLPQYHSTFIIKTLYEKPKNLPGEDPENPDVKLLSTSMSSIDSADLEDEQNKINNTNNNTLGNESIQNSQTNNTIRNMQKGKSSQNQVNINNVKQFVYEIINSNEFKIKTPELGCIIDDEMAGKVQEDIIQAKKEEEKKREEEENKKLSEGDNKNQNKEEKKKEVNEIIQYSFDPAVPEGWSNGNFELVINHCYDCHNHQKTTRHHYEYTFVEKFNQIGEAVKNQFPNAVVIGNLDEQEYLSNFDVYLRHTGLPCDYKGRYVVYCKRDTKQFPSVTDIVDKLICLSIMYGSSMNVEKAQFEDLKADMIKSKICHEHPATLSEKAEKIKQKILSKKPETKIDPERTPFFCLNNGCNKEFVQNKNKSNSCRYHPGVYQFGSYNGYWPECWTCCEGKWNAPGCKKGKHNGVLAENRIMLCINHGEPGEDGHPDSACGTWFTNRSIDGCKFHSGFIEKGVYTCCQGGKDSPGCQEGQHRTATFPEPEAKLYFYPKILNNPGLKFDKKEVLPTVADQIKACGYFKKIQEYPEVGKIYKRKKDKEEREKEMDRICFNVGCKKIYKETNNDDKCCKCHPGRWDFGGNGSGVKMSDIYYKYNHPIDDKILLDNIWKPHWTCCGGDWKSKPCTRCRHHGPLKRDEEKYEGRFKYPDVRYKLYFKRVVSDKWTSYMENYQLTEARLRKICESWTSPIRIDELPKICDKLYMNYLILQEDPSYAMKYWDIIEKSNSIEYFCKEDMCEKEKFIKWWFTDYLTIYNELHPPVKKENKIKKEEQKNNA